MAESEEELDGLLTRVKQESEKASLKFNIQKTNINTRSQHLRANRRGKHGSSEISFSWAPKLLWMVTAAMKLKDTCFLQEKPSET